MNIVVIDDEPKVRKGVMNLLNMQDNIFAESFDNAADALDYLYLHDVDLVITDIRMPGMSGLDMIESLKRRNPLVPVVILSGYSRFDYAQRAIELGVRKYMTKPTDPKALLEVVSGVQHERDGEADMLRQSGLPCAGNISNLLILRAIEYMSNHFAVKLTLKDVADNLYISPNYLSELFRKCTGVRFSDYLNQMRLEKAKYLLKDVRFSIGQVSDSVGFSNYRYFNTLFKKYTGMTPKEYRNSNSDDFS